MLALAGLACAVSFPDVSTATPEPTKPEPTFTPLAQLPPAPTLAPTGVGANLLDEVDLATLYQRVYPGVVTIWTYVDLGPPHESSVPAGQGSGFVIDLDGHIVTNQHVVSDAEAVEVDFASGFRAWATVLGTDPDSDLAVLEVDAPQEILFPLPLGDSDEVHVGEFVVAIGNPFGLTGTMTVGIVSAIGRTLPSIREAPTGGMFTAGAIIQTDAAINPGNSGGPLINLRGEVIGVNQSIRTDSFTPTGDATNSGIGFALPVNIVRRVAPSLIENGFYAYPYLGITSISGSGLNLRVLEDLNLASDTTGAYVTCVTPGGPADEAGIIGASPCESVQTAPGGDVIIAIDDTRVTEFNDLLAYLIMETQPGQEILITVLRDGEEVTLSLVVGARP
jgi:2-alkenal reductase